MSRVVPQPDDLPRILRDMQTRLIAMERRTQGPRMLGPFVTPQTTLSAGGAATSVNGVHNLNLTPDGYDIDGYLTAAFAPSLMWHVAARLANEVVFALDPSSSTASITCQIRFYVLLAAPGDAS